jgi:hypothetical protein
VSKDVTWRNGTKQQTSTKTACDSHNTKVGTACPVFGLCTLEQRRDEGHFQRVRLFWYTGTLKASLLRRVSECACLL